MHLPWVGATSLSFERDKTLPSNSHSLTVNWMPGLKAHGSIKRSIKWSGKAMTYQGNGKSSALMGWGNSSPRSPWSSLDCQGLSMCTVSRTTPFLSRWSETEQNIRKCQTSEIKLTNTFLHCLRNSAYREKCNSVLLDGFLTAQVKKKYFIWYITEYWNQEAISVWKAPTETQFSVASLDRTKV